MQKIKEIFVPDEQREKFMHEVLGSLENDKLDAKSRPLFLVSVVKNKIMDIMMTFNDLLIENEEKKILVCMRDSSQSTTL